MKYFYCVFTMYMASICEKKMIGCTIYSIEFYHFMKSEYTQMWTKQIKQNIFKLMGSIDFSGLSISKSNSISERNSIHERNSMSKSNSIMESNSMSKLNLMSQSNLLSESNSVSTSNSMSESDSLSESNSIWKSNLISKRVSI